MVVLFYKIPLFSKDLVSFIIFFILLFVSIIPEPSDKNYFLVKLRPASKRSFGTSSLNLSRAEFAETPGPSSAIASLNFRKGSINPPNCTILERWDFGNFILADEPFAKALQILETWVTVNNDLYGKLVSSLVSPNTFDERFKVTFVPFFILDFNSLSC